MSKKSKGGSNLGRTLIKDRFSQKNRRKVDNDSMLHTTEVQDGYDWGRLNLASVTEESTFQEFLRTAELAGTEFQAEKLNIAFVNQKCGTGLLSQVKQQHIEKKYEDNRELLKIPRRPKWTTTTSAEELQAAEKASFLVWRRGLALLQEDEEIVLTPYEKNLEFWRQLWRVVERSDVVVQIVDARNPLLFRSADLEKYVMEVDPNKMNLILVNKSDLLTEQQRIVWAEYFESEGRRIAFFSAAMAEEELAALKEDRKGETEIHVSTSGEEMSLCNVKKAVENINQALDHLELQINFIERKIEPVVRAQPSIEKAIKNNSKVLTRVELISLFKTIYTGPTKTDSYTTIGLVGYPNVGKSSTINSLMTEKKVSVSATPGKTKHFQTLFLDSDVMLCDCPGLVMPSFVLTKADMILNGILPIDQMRDHVGAVNLLCTRIPRHILEDKYGIIIARPMEGEDPDRPPHSEELLLAYGYNRGFMTANGQPDQSRSARLVCKDYVNGKLLYCIAPPTVPQQKYHTFPIKKRKEVSEKALPTQQQRAMRINKNTSSTEVDQQFFDSNCRKAYVKGRTSFPHIRVAESNNLLSRAEFNTVKPWRSIKKEKHEKLRKKFAHLDQH